MRAATFGLLLSSGAVTTLASIGMAARFGSGDGIAVDARAIPADL